MSYSEPSVEERGTIQFGQAQGISLRAIAHLINRSPPTISRELRRNRDVNQHPKVSSCSGDFHRLFTLLEAERIVACFEGFAVVGDTVEQCCGHLGVAEYAAPFAE